ncbi:CoA binding domain-containing protein [Xylaria sp. FL0043]|nr:CoA binding domain-containing protein [Xylaria sp. FL0043]
MLKMAAEASVRAFFSSPQFAVVGASSNPAKFGHKVFVWYKDRNLPVVPINPAPSITTRYGEHATVKSVAELADPENISLSVITPPPVTLEVLKEAKRVGIPAVWLQPGTFDDEVMRFARGGKEAGGYEGEIIAGEGGAGSEGWCVLVDGDKGLRAAGKL